MSDKPIFLTVLDNGNEDVKRNYMIAFFWAFKDKDVRICAVSDSSPTRNGNRAAADFLESECDVWVNIDADIIFQTKDVDNLLSHPELLVFGIYPKKNEQCHPCCATLENKEPVANEAGLKIMRRCGRGFMLVRRELLEKMKEENGGPALRYHNSGRIEWDFFPASAVSGSKSVRIEGGRELLTEDWFFCEFARSVGVPVMADARIALAHQGQYIYRFHQDQIAKP